MLPDARAPPSRVVPRDVGGERRRGAAAESGAPRGVAGRGPLEANLGTRGGSGPTSASFLPLSLHYLRS